MDMITNRKSIFSYYSVIFTIIISFAIDTFACVYKSFLNIELYNIFRIIGRIYFPLFSFIILDYYKNNNKINTIFILLLFGIINNFIKEIMFFIGAQTLYEQNFLITIVIGLITLEFYNYYLKVNKFITFIVILSFMLVSEFIYSDYASYGILMILIFGLSKDNFSLIIYLISLNILNLTTEYFFYKNISILQIFSLLSFPFIYFYKRKVLNKKLNIFFYLILMLFVHLFICLSRYFIFGY